METEINTSRRRKNLPAAVAEHEEELQQQQQAHEVLELTPMEQEDFELLQMLKGTDSSDYKIRVSRKGKHDSDYAYQGEQSASMSFMEEIKNLYGGGDYILNFVNGSGKFVKRVKRTIGYDIKPLSERSLQTVTSQGVPDNNMNFITFMQQSNDKMMAMQQASSQQMLTLVTAIIGRPVEQKPQPEPTSKLLTVLSPLLIPLVTKAADRFFSERTEKKGFLSSIEELRTLKEVMPELFATPEAAPEKGFMDKALDIISPLAQVFIARAQGQQQLQMPKDAQQQQTQEEPTPMKQAVALPPGLPTVAYKMQELLMKLQSNIAPCVMAAKMKFPVDNVVDMVLGNESQEGLIPSDDEELYNEFINILQLPNWLEILFNNDARVMEQQAWFESLRQALLDDAKDNEQQDTTTEQSV